MIRFKKPVKLLEWGEGTNTTNQIWSTLGEGRFTKRAIKDGHVVLTVETGQPIQRKNQKDNSVKLCQQSEGMTANSEHWGEVATGHINSISGNTVVVDIEHATKISDSSGWDFLGLLKRFFYAAGND